MNGWKLSNERLDALSELSQLNSSMVPGPRWHKWLDSLSELSQLNNSMVPGPRWQFSLGFAGIDSEDQTGAFPKGAQGLCPRQIQGQQQI